MRKRNSPYSKFHKVPHIYSIAYQEWKRAAVKFGACSDEALHAACIHARHVAAPLAERCLTELERRLKDDRPFERTNHV